MARTKSPERTIQKNIAIPEDICARMELELYSDLEGKIPFGAQQALVVKLLRQHFRIIDNARMRAAKAEKFDLAVVELQRMEEGN
jgi:hypothetical protein